MACFGAPEESTESAVPGLTGFPFLAAITGFTNVAEPLLERFVRPIITRVRRERPVFMAPMFLIPVQHRFNPIETH